MSQFTPKDSMKVRMANSWCGFEDNLDCHRSEVKMKIATLNTGNLVKSFINKLYKMNDVIRVVP